MDPSLRHRLSPNQEPVCCYDVGGQDGLVFLLKTPNIGTKGFFGNSSVTVEGTPKFPPYIVAIHPGHDSVWDCGEVDEPYWINQGVNSSMQIAPREMVRA
jgi:hypothetical protein